MESRPPQEPSPPRRPAPPNGRKPGPSAAAPAPPWVWVLLVGAFAGLLWWLGSANNTVTYSFFRQQVADDNVEEVQIAGLTVTGSLRADTKYTASPSHSTKTI